MKKMRVTTLVLATALSFCLLANTSNAAEKKSPTKEPQCTKKAQCKDGWVSLFDGKTLKGWHHVGDGEWLVEDGAIVGKTQKAAKLYGLLVSDNEYENLRVKFKFKSLAGNSGFYVRCYIQPPDQAQGLQVEVDPRSNTGGIYESYGRCWVSKPDAEVVKKAFKLDKWNEMEILADGGHVVTWLNGTKIGELKNDPAVDPGHLVMQMHSGNKMLVMFKDIKVLDLNKKKAK